MKILLVNDDGYNASGLVALKEILKNYVEDYVVAPASGKSGAGCGLTTFNPIKAFFTSNGIVKNVPLLCKGFKFYLLIF